MLKPLFQSWVCPGFSVVFRSLCFPSLCLPGHSPDSRNAIRMKEFSHFWIESCSGLKIVVFHYSYHLNLLQIPALFQA